MMGATTWAAQVGVVQENSPAFHAGIKTNDEIIKINDRTKYSLYLVIENIFEVK